MHEIIRALENTQSRNEKEDIVEKAWYDGNIQFFEGVALAYDKLITFGVKKVPLYELDGNESFSDLYTGDGFTWNNFRELLDNLYKRNLTGNEAQATIKNAASLSSMLEWNYWYRRILIKDLKCGVSESTVNKVLLKIAEKDKNALKYIVPVFECQLAEAASKHPKKMVGKKWIDFKYDGVRILSVLDYEHKSVTMYTRNGNISENFPNIIEVLTNFMMKTKFSMVLDGEIMSRSFQELMQHFNKKSKDVIDSYYALFDVLSLSEFKKGISETSLDERTQLLAELQPLLLEHCGSSVWVIPKKKVDLSTKEGRQELQEFMDEAVAAGYEGVMVKDPKALYECKRSSSWLKIKPKIRVTLTVVGFEQGTENKKFSNTLGALVCEGYDEDKFIKTNVSGFSDAVRHDLWANREKLLGQLVEVEADAIIDGKKNKGVIEYYSLRFPEYKGFRSINRVVGEKD